jgi:pimeloyl-ACP methyl ester carboxylesterase
MDSCRGSRQNRKRVAHVFKKTIAGAAAVLALSLAPFVIRAAVAGVSTLVEKNRYPPPGKLIDIGGYRLHLYCTGQGEPVVVLESGLGTDWTTWRLVAPELAQLARVCVYDRAGYGWSEVSPKPRTSTSIAGELHQLLKNAGEHGPLVLIGHSFGAYVVRSFANSFPEATAGLVLVDPSHEDFPAGAKALGLDEMSIPPRPWFDWHGTGLSRLRKLWKGDEALLPDLKNAPEPFRHRAIIWSPPAQLITEHEELAGLRRSEAEARAAVIPAGIPLVVISGAPAATQTAIDPVWALRLRLHANLAAGWRHIRAAGSGHFVQLDDPKLVVSAIQDIISGIRTSRGHI